MKEQLFKDVYDEELGQGAIINDRHPGFRQDYLLLHVLLRRYNIKSCFEIGCHTGFGTKIIKNALGEDSVVFSLDLPDELADISKQHPLSEKKKGVGFECNLPFVLLRGDSRTFDYSKYPTEAFYCDAEHSYENVFVETKAMISMSPQLIIFHDADSENVYNAIIDAFKWNEDYELVRVIDTRILYCVKK